MFRKIGHFSIDDNMKSNLQTRELKTVYIECSCQYLLLRMVKCHANSENRFNQVSIIRMAVYGTMLGNYEASALNLGPVNSEMRIEL